MNRRILVTVSLPLAIVAVVLFAIAGILALRYQAYEKRINDDNAKSLAAAKLAGDSGTQFRVQGRPVESVLIGVPQSEVHRGDSIVLVLKLRDRNASGDESQVANEANGVLTPTLTVADCTVTPQTAALAKATDQPVAAFVWQWSVDDCKSVGDKAVQVLLAFAGPPGDPVADRELAFIHVSDALSWDDAVRLLGFISGVLAALSAIGAYFRKPKENEPAATR